MFYEVMGICVNTITMFIKTTTPLYDGVIPLYI
jgi:hypothetical protein